MVNKSYVIAVNMIPYGIEAVIKTTTTLVDQMICGFEELILGNRENAVNYHAKMKNKLLKEDAFFNRHPKAAKVQQERWVNFCDLCVDFAALNAVLYKEPIYLVHPEQYEERRSHGLIDLASPGGLDLIPDIPVMKMAA